MKNLLGNIKTKEFLGENFNADAIEILLIGVNHDRDNVNKPHSCVIEKLVHGMGRTGL